MLNHHKKQIVLIVEMLEVAEQRAYAGLEKVGAVVCPKDSFMGRRHGLAYHKDTLSMPDTADYSQFAGLRTFVSCSMSEDGEYVFVGIFTDTGDN